MTTTTYQFSGAPFTYTYQGGPANRGANLLGTVVFNFVTSHATGLFGASTTQLSVPNLNNGVSNPIVDVLLGSGIYSGSLSSSTELNGGPVFYLNNGAIAQWYADFVSS